MKLSVTSLVVVGLAVGLDVLLADRRGRRARRPRGCRFAVLLDD